MLLDLIPSILNFDLPGPFGPLRPHDSLGSRDSLTLEIWDDWKRSRGCLGWRSRAILDH